MLELYRNIKKERKKKGWTQTELATKVGYADKSMIAKIETGKVDLPQSKIMEFAKVFGVKAGDLMGLDGTIEALVAQINYKEGKLDELVTCCEDFSDDEYDKLIEYAEFIKLKRENNGK